MDMATTEKKIRNMMEDNNIMGSIVAYNGITRMIAVEIIWGDWKHEHRYLDYLVEKYIGNLRSIHTQTTEEDGSDCYSAIHYYYFN